MAKKLKQRVGELMRSRHLTYSIFAAKVGIGIKTAKALYEDPHHNLTGSTLSKCAEFFQMEPGALVVDEETDLDKSKSAISVKPPTESDFFFRFLELFLPQPMLEQVKKATPKGITTFLYEAIAEKLEREGQLKSSPPEENPEFRDCYALTNS